MASATPRPTRGFAPSDDAHDREGALRAGFAGKRVLVIGGYGFIGRNIIRTLLRIGADVTSLVRKRLSTADQGLWATVEGDMKDPDTIRGAIHGHDIILNLAGVTSAVTSNRSPSFSLMEECLPHLNLLAACVEQKTRPLIVFPSSRLVYGRPEYLPVDEKHPTNPTNVYGIHKLTVEHYLRIYHELAGIPYLIFRISNPFGPLQPRDKSYGILNMFIQRAVAGQPILLFGNGNHRRDFIYIDDLVDVMLHAILAPACHNNIYNLGGPSPISLLEAAQTIAACVEGAEIAFQPWPEDYLRVETGDYFACFDRLAQHLPPPHFLPFDRAIAQTVRAYRNA